MSVCLGEDGLWLETACGLYQPKPIQCWRSGLLGIAVPSIGFDVSNLQQAPQPAQGGYSDLWKAFAPGLGVRIQLRSVSLSQPISRLELTLPVAWNILPPLGHLLTSPTWPCCTSHQTECSGWRIAQAFPPCQLTLGVKKQFWVLLWHPAPAECWPTTGLGSQGFKSDVTEASFPMVNKLTLYYA